MSKGSARRNEDIKKVWDNWDAIFKKDKPQEEEQIKEQLPEQQPPKDNAK